VDITERKDLESELREAVRIRDEFLSIASHELRTPLTSLRLRAERLELHLDRDPVEALANGRLERDARSAVKHVRQLVSMVDVLLDVSRLSEGPLTLERERLEIGALVTGVADILSEPAATAGCAVDVQVKDIAIAYWDRFRIEQVVTNLLSNAMKYGRGKPIEVLVALDRAGEKAFITVTDRGPGISLEHQPRVFDRFARFASARVYGGFGLGLWITREIVQAHGGSIAIDSKLGAGASFRVELPLGTAGEAAASGVGARILRDLG
jgi:signal transduction histidine kinase